MMPESNYSNSISRAKLSCIAGMIVLFCLMNVFAAIAADNPKALVLHSYHSGFQWTDDQNSAIITALQSSYPEGDVFVEYMNTKRVALDVMSPMLRQNYATLFRNARPDVIIATDNNALDFLLKYGDELFPGVPVVFCGINNFDDYNLGNHRNYTGVREDFDTGATLDIMLRFHPDTHTVAMIADVTESSQITLAIARKVAKAKKYGNIRFVELSGLSETELADKLGKLEKGTIILLLSYYRSPEGRVFSVKDGTQLIQKHTQLPVYALWDFYMLPPVIGGKIVTGTLQGKAAGEIAVRILKGEKPEAIPPYSTPTSYYFNYDALQKHTIPASLIPADSIVVGKPDTFYARYKTYIRIGAAFALTLIATILILLRSIVLQRRNEAALRASEEKFRVLFENALEGIYQTSLDGRLLNANPALAQILAFSTPDELKARLTNVWQQLFLSPEEGDLFLSSILQQGTVRGLELQCRHKDKQTIWVSINARLVYDEAGEPLFVEGFLSDISDRKRAEEELHQLTLFQRTILENVAYGIVATTPEGIIRSFNRAAERLLGYSADEVVGMVTPARWHDPAEIAQRALQLSKELGETVPAGFDVFASRPSRNLREENEWTFIRKDGMRVPVLLSVTALRDESGQITGFVGLTYDLTERKRAEEESRENDARYRRIVDTASEGIWALGRDSLTEFVNTRMADMIGYGVEEMIGRPMTDFMPGEDCPDHGRRMENRHNGISETYERRFRRKDESIVWTLASATPIFDDAHRFSGSFAMFTDITEKKLAEEELHKLNEDLEQRVIRRTGELEKKSLELQDSQSALMNIVDDLNQKTEELEQANIKLKDLDRLKSMFIASMSHELRTPLNSIIGFSSIMMNEWAGPVTAEQKENLSAVLRAGKHLLSLINDVIDVSKIEAGRIESISEDFDLNSVVMEAVETFSKEIRGKKLELKVSATGQMLHTDRRRLLQCLLNLVSNAVKFTEKGTITVSSAISSNQQDVELSVEDTGIGIRPEETEKLFSPFVRLDSPLKSLVPGTGLGLYLTRKIVREVLKGDILVRSVYGEGSAFTLILPMSIMRRA